MSPVSAGTRLLALSSVLISLVSNFVGIYLALRRKPSTKSITQVRVEHSFDEKCATESKAYKAIQSQLKKEHTPGYLADCEDELGETTDIKKCNTQKRIRRYSKSERDLHQRYHDTPSADEDE